MVVETSDLAIKRLKWKRLTEKALWLILPWRPSNGSYRSRRCPRDIDRPKSCLREIPLSVKSLNWDVSSRYHCVFVHKGEGMPFVEINFIEQDTCVQQVVGADKKLILDRSLQAAGV